MEKKINRLLSMLLILALLVPILPILPLQEVYGDTNIGSGIS